MSHLGRWFGGGLGSVGGMIGLHDLRGLFQPQRFYAANTLHFKPSVLTRLPFEIQI